MTLPELMRKGWKPELPSDTLLRENPAAYDASPMPTCRITYFNEYAKPPRFKAHLPDATGYVSTCGNIVLYGDRNAKPAKYQDWLEGKRSGRAIPADRKYQKIKTAHPSIEPFVSRVEYTCAPKPPKKKKKKNRPFIPGLARWRVAECEVCEEMLRVQRHHIIPFEYWYNGPTADVCEQCHANVHFFFTNERLCETDWNDVVAEVRKHTIYSLPQPAT